jgi:hypothetical protein
MRRGRRRNEPGQVLILFVLIISLLMIPAVVVMFNVVMIETSAITTVDNSLRLAGIAALQDRAPGTAAYSTWIFDDDNTKVSGSVLDCTVQRLVYENLAPQIGMFVSDPSAVTGYNATTGCGPLPASLSVEALAPLPAPAQSVSILNGGAPTSNGCGSVSGVAFCTSSLNGVHYTKPTIVVRLSVQIVQLGNLTWLPPGGGMMRTVVVSAGTDG